MNYILVAALIINVPAIRQVNLSGPVADVQSRLPNNVYWDNNAITCVHESTHGINSLLRNQYQRPAFYLLDGKAILLNEPRTTISEVARLVPPSLRGDIYQLYLVSQQRYWNKQPSYLFNEFVSYINSAVARQRLGIQTQGETQYAMEFIVYSTCVVQAAYANGEADRNTRDFLMSQIERILPLTNDRNYLLRLQNNDATELRIFMQRYYGIEWTKKLGV